MRNRFWSRVAGLFAGMLVSTGMCQAQCAGRWLPGSGVAGVDGRAAAFVILDGDTILVGGQFSLAGTTPVRDMAIWDRGLGSFRALPSFEFGAQRVFLNCMTRLADGRIVAGGGFGSDGLGRYRGLAFVDPAVDQTIPVVLAWDAWVHSISPTPDGRAFLGGGFNADNVQTFTPAGIWNPVSNEFEPLIDESVQYWTNLHAVLAHSSGELLIGLADFQGLPYLHGGVFRWDAEHHRWSPLGGGVWPSGDPTEFETVVTSMIELRNRDVLVGGRFSFADQLPSDGLALYSFAAGRWVPVPQIGDRSTIRGLAELPDGSVLVAGSIRLADGREASTARVRLDTGEITPISLGGSVSSEGGEPALTVLPDGSVLLGMSEAWGTSLPPRGMALLPAGGDHWTNVTDGDAGFADALALTPTGEVLASGRFTRLQGVEANGLATYDPRTGRVEACSNQIGSWSGGFSPLPDGTLVAARGVVPFAGSNTLGGVGLYDPIARIGYEFDPPEQTWVSSAVPLPSGEIVAVLELRWTTEGTYSQLARLHRSTGTWTPLGDPFACCVSIYAYPDGRVLVYGEHYDDGGNRVESLSLVDPYSGESTSIPVGEFDRLTSISALPDGDVLAFVHYLGSPIHPPSGWVRYQTGEWLPQPLPDGVSLGRTPLNSSLVGNGDLLFTGSTNAGETVLYRYLWQTGVWEAASGDVQSDGYLLSAVELPGGDIVLAGDFSQVGGQIASGFARWTTLCSDPCDPDINRDGNADSDDVAALIDVIAGGLNTLRINPDFNHDGNADQTDIDALVNVVAGGECP